ncbi:MAG TPA: nitrogenase cofactor biosynthesis protein NifB [Patescibacteria group bacterium]|nr:nitrogenase cofactor biosynthesis protein NifB [Patescibacteria group bacterium]
MEDNVDRQVISLPSVAKATGGCSSTGDSACGSSSGQGDMPAEVWAKVKDHPCYSEEAHHYFARMHVAVAPACNIQCNYCNRKFDCSNESRPGVVSEKLTPEDAVRKVIAVAAKVPQLSVLGIAGPGDALANPHKTFKTFELVDKALPHLKLCLSTNGLALPDYVDQIKDFNVDHVTITISMVDPEIGEQIYPWIFYNHRRWTGRDAAKILHERQMEGLEALTSAGILVKVNSVLIPGVNDHHMAEINRVVKSKGAFLHNVMPLISDPAHGTHYGLTGQRGPTPMELQAVQEQLEGGAKLMRHCRQCRADAVGLLGEDLGSDFTLDKIEAEPVYTPDARDVYMGVVEQERTDRHTAEDEAREAASFAEPGAPLLVAIATKGGGRINQHFGHALEFQLYQVDGREVRFLGVRRADNYCKGGFGEDDSMETIIKALSGVSVVMVARIGDCPKKSLAEAGVTVIDDYAHEYIEASALAWWSRVNADRANGLMASA